MVVGFALGKTVEGAAEGTTVGFALGIAVEG